MIAAILLSIVLNLHIAETPTERQWGLMGKKSLEENEGMLFVYEEPKILSVWMFNCWVDLSVAFLDEHFKILQIEELKANPEMMDPRRPVYKLSDINLYQRDGAVWTFYKQHKAISRQRAKYTLEMPANWFQKNGFREGDTLNLRKEGAVFAINN